MKLPQRLLQLGTLALFSSMIGSLVIYRGGFFDPSPPRVKLEQDSLQPPWFDSLLFKRILRETVEQSFMDNGQRIYVLNGAPSAPPPQKKKGKKKHTNDDGVRIATPADSLHAMEILRSFYELTHLSESEQQRFQIVLDGLTRPRMMSSKTGWIFISAVDTSKAIQIVLSERLKK